MEDKITEKTEVSTSEIAALLGITARYVRQLTEDGILAKTAPGKYPLFENVQSYIDYKSRDDLDEAEAALEKKKLAAEVRLKTAKAKVAQMEAQPVEGNRGGRAQGRRAGKSAQGLRTPESGRRDSEGLVKVKGPGFPKPFLLIPPAGASIPPAAPGRS